MSELLQRIEFAELGDVVATLDRDAGVLVIDRQAPPEDVAWVLSDVATWLLTGRAEHARRQRHLQLLPSRSPARGVLLGHGAGDAGGGAA